VEIFKTELRSLQKALTEPGILEPGTVTAYYYIQQWKKDLEHQNKRMFFKFDSRNLLRGNRRSVRLLLTGGAERESSKAKTNACYP